MGAPTLMRAIRGIVVVVPSVVVRVIEDLALADGAVCPSAQVPMLSDG